MPTRGSSCLGAGDAIVNITAQPEVEAPVLYRDGVLDVQRRFLDVGVTVIGVQPAGGLSRGAAVGGRQRRRPGQVVAAQQGGKGRLPIPAHVLAT